MLVGASKTSWQGGSLPFDLGGLGMPGCKLFCDIVVHQAVANVGGRGTWTATVPNSSALLGGIFYNQALVDDPGVNLFGAVMTNAAEANIGQ